ncbi:MAG: response regulator [Alphaproteobacteria bacterium]
MRLLIVEDNNELATVLSRILRAEGHVVDVATNGLDADALLAAEFFDLVVLDLGLPQMDGLDVLRRLRNRSSDTIVLVLTARSELADRVKGLDLGADDYIAKPFQVEELEARIRALLRRRAGATGSVIRIGDLAFDVTARTVLIADNMIELPKRELDLLEALILRTGRVTPKSELSEAISSQDDAISEGALELYISRLRKKVEQAGLRIRTLRGLGYMLEAV